MTSPTRRSIGETLAELDALNPELATEIRVALSAKRLRDDLADAESLLREHARTARDSIGRALAVLLVEYDARAGRVVRAPSMSAAVPTPAVPPAQPTVRNEKGDVVL